MCRNGSWPILNISNMFINFGFLIIIIHLLIPIQLNHRPHQILELNHETHETTTHAIWDIIACVVISCVSDGGDNNLTFGFQQTTTKVKNHLKGRKSYWKLSLYAVIWFNLRERDGIKTGTFVAYSSLGWIELYELAPVSSSREIIYFSFGQDLFKCLPLLFW